jgi:hypothetical protein
MTTIPTYDQLRTLLIENVCIVEFTKVNGEIRAMPCTLKESLIPSVDKPETSPSDLPKKEKKINPDVMNVWCTDKQQWRSFRLNNVISIKVADVEDTRTSG